MIRPRTRRGVVSELAAALSASSPAGDAGLAPAVSLLAAPAAPRVAIITDLLGDAGALLAESRLAIAGGAEVVLLHLMTPEELDPPADAQLAVDPEQPALRRSLDADGRKRYRDALDAWLARMQAEFRDGGVRYVRALSSEPATRIVRRIAAHAPAGT
jgi:hypothetical protein